METPDKSTVYVRATQDRKQWGGIWALGAFITLNWHKLELTPEQVEEAKANYWLQVSDGEGFDEESTVIASKDTHFASSPPPATSAFFDSIGAVALEATSAEDEFVDPNIEALLDGQATANDPNGLGAEPTLDVSDDLPDTDQNPALDEPTDDELGDLLADETTAKPKRSRK